MKSIYVFSNKFSPAHFSHLIAYYYLIEESKNECTLVLHNDYKNFVQESKEKLNIIYLDEWKSSNIKCDLAIIYNISSVDHKYIDDLKKINEKIKFFTIVHEPWTGWKNTFSDYFKHNEYFKETIKRIGRKFYLKKLIKRNTQIIVCSKNAKQIFERYYKNIKTYVIPLLFCDELKCDLSKVNKKYFSFIGSAGVSHGFNDFIKFIKEHKDDNIQFQIATSTNIESYLDEELKQLIFENKLIVRHGKYLSNEEINDCYARANVLWLFYKRTTQSGCLCKSFMFGTPVICSNVGSFSEYVDVNNGRIVNDYDSIFGAYLALINQNNNIKNCRSSFAEFFDCENKVDYLKNILLK